MNETIKIKIKISIFKFQNSCLSIFLIKNSNCIQIVQVCKYFYPCTNNVNMCIFVIYNYIICTWIEIFMYYKYYRNPIFKINKNKCKYINMTYK